METLKPKPIYLQVRMSPEEKEQFFEVCKSKAINPSELIRQFCSQYVKEHKQKEGES